MTPLSKADFYGLEHNVWLYCGAEAPLHRGVENAVHEYLRRRSLGPQGREYNAEIEASCRGKFARLLGSEIGDIALLSNATEAIASILLALRLQPGENIVLHDLEYPSGVLGSLALQECGAEVRIVGHREWEIGNDELLAQVDENTRLVLSSHVSYMSGTRFDYESLYRELQSTSTLLLLDATQSLGCVPVSLGHADFIVCSSYKWLLGMHGLGLLAINPARTSDLVPRSAGWRGVENLFSHRRFEAIERYEDARRFELGFPSYATIAALDCSLDALLDCGIQSIEKHVIRLGALLMAGLAELDLTLMTPIGAQSRAGNIAIVAQHGEQLAQALLTDRVIVWGGDGRLRYSIHGFNDEADIEAALLATRKALRS